MRPDGPRDLYAGPDDGPVPPFPLKVSGEIVKGFGRGSKELGIPTANIPLSGLSIGGSEELESGIYFGWAGLDFPAHDETNGASTTERLKNIGAKFATPLKGEEDTVDAQLGSSVYPMVMSVGWNPFYKNTVRSLEVHIMHKFSHDFYGHHLNLLILGFIRPEYDYISRESLIDDINIDIEVTHRSLDRPSYAKWKQDAFLTTFCAGNDPLNG